MDKKVARREYKEKKSTRGIFAIRSKASGDTWIGASEHLDTQRNSLWFQLRSSMNLNRSLQAAWTAHGEAAFEFQVLERLKDDVSALLVKDTLRERREHWQRELGAAAL